MKKLVQRPVMLIILIVIFLVSCTYGPRPQIPKERPYLIQEVSFTSKNPKIRLAGELTLPNVPGPHPAIILITGSGPQNRDEELFGHKPFLVIADHLTRMGFAVLRYDDRGVGESSGDFSEADIHDFADDASGAFAWLKKQPFVDGEKIGYLGHSEGGYIAPLAAQQTPAKFMVFLAAPIKRLLPDTMITQSKDIARSLGQSDATIDNYASQYIKLTEILRTSQNQQEAELGIIQWLKKAGAKKSEIKNTIKLFANRWGIAYASYDPMPALTSFKKPVLALFGGTDLQVSAKENIPIMREVLTHPFSRVCLFPNKNHLFQNSVTGKISEYHKITTTIEPEVLNSISHWLNYAVKENKELRWSCSSGIIKANK